MHDQNVGIIIAICVFVIGVVLFLIFRAFWLWYFGVDAIVDLLEEIRDRLPAPSKVSTPQEQAKPELTAFERKRGTKCTSCGALLEVDCDAQFCNRCGAPLKRHAP